jgi:hypothetical protein
MALCQSPSFAHEKGLTPQFRGTYRRFDNTDKSDCYDAIPKFAYFQYRWELAVFKGFTGTIVREFRRERPQVPAINKKLIEERYTDTQPGILSGEAE